MDEQKVTAALIIEVIGRPAEHLSTTLEEITKKIDEEKKVKVVEKKINEPKEMKNKPDFFTNFAEVEVEVENIMYLIMLMYKYMPAHVEIISPEKITLNNNDLGEVLSELIRRLHGYDEITRVVQVEKKILENKLKALLEEKNKDKEKTTDSKESEEKESEEKEPSEK